MRKTMIAGAAAAALAAVAGAAWAQTGSPTASPAPHAGAERHALRGDLDRDGRVTQAEFVDSRLARLTASDADGDGVVTPEEAQASRQARRAEMADKRFARLDADSDGSISRAEFDGGHAARGERGPRAERAGRRLGRAGPMRAGRQGERGPIAVADVRARLTEQFAKLDADRDGVVTAEEQRAARQAWGEQRRERRAARRMQQPASPAPASE